MFLLLIQMTDKPAIFLNLLKWGANSMGRTCQLTSAMGQPIRIASKGEFP